MSVKGVRMCVWWCGRGWVEHAQSYIAKVLTSVLWLFGQHAVGMTVSAG